MSLPLICMEGVAAGFARPDKGLGAVRHSKDYLFKVTLWKDL
jgi:hypothetical protein